MRVSPLPALLAASAVLLAGCRPDTIWAPDGKSLAVAAPNGLYRFDLAKERFEPLVRAPQHAVNPAWSADGKRLCYFLTTAQRGKVNSASLAVLDLASHKQTVVVPKLSLPDPSNGQPTRNPALLLKQTFTASWSPDGSRIAYITYEAGRSVLAVVPAAGGPSKRLTAPPNEALAPAWSPTGAEIAYLVEARGKPGPGGFPAAHGAITVHSIQPDGKGHRLLWTPPEGLALNPVPLGPQWAKDGKSLAVIAEKTSAGDDPDASPTSQVWVIPREGGGEGLIDIPGAAIGASLSADLKSVVFYGATPRDRKHLKVSLLTAPYKQPQVLYTLDVPEKPPAGGGEPGELDAPPIPTLAPDGSHVALLHAFGPGPARLLLAAPGDKEPRSYLLPAGK